MSDLQEALRLKIIECNQTREQLIEKTKLIKQLEAENREFKDIIRSQDVKIERLR